MEVQEDFKELLALLNAHDKDRRNVVFPIVLSSLTESSVRLFCGINLYPPLSCNIETLWLIELSKDKSLL